MDGSMLARLVPPRAVLAQADEAAFAKQRKVSMPLVQKIIDDFSEYAP